MIVALCNSTFFELSKVQNRPKHCCVTIKTLRHISRISGRPKAENSRTRFKISGLSAKSSNWSADRLWRRWWRTTLTIVCRSLSSQSHTWSSQNCFGKEAINSGKMLSAARVLSRKVADCTRYGLDVGAKRNFSHLRSNVSIVSIRRCRFSLICSFANVLRIGYVTFTKVYFLTGHEQQWFYVVVCLGTISEVNVQSDKIASHLRFRPPRKYTTRNMTSKHVSSKYRTHQNEQTTQVYHL